MRTRAFLMLPIFLIMSAALLACDAESSNHEADFFRVTIEGAKHVTEVAVQGPSKEFIYLRQPNIKCDGISYKNGVLTISYEKSIGVTWRDGKLTATPVFDVAGKYRVYVGDNLETELGNSYSRTFDLVYHPKNLVEVDAARVCIVDGKEIKETH